MGYREAAKKCLRSPAYMLSLCFSTALAGAVLQHEWLVFIAILLLGVAIGDGLLKLGVKPKKTTILLGAALYILLLPFTYVVLRDFLVVQTHPLIMLAEITIFMVISTIVTIVVAVKSAVIRKKKQSENTTGQPAIRH